MSLLLSEEVLKYREYEVDVAVKVIKQLLVASDVNDFQFSSGKLDAVRAFINLPQGINPKSTSAFAILKSPYSVTDISLSET